MNFILHHKREFFDGVILALFTIFVQQFSLQTRAEDYLIGVGLGVVLVLITIYINYKRSINTMIQFEFPRVDTYTKWTEVIYYIALPLCFYLSNAAFIRVVNRNDLAIPLFTISLVIYFNFFVNLKAHFLDKFKLAAQTQFVFEFIKMFIYFAAVLFILTISVSLGFSEFVAIGLIFVVASLLTYLLLLGRKNFLIFDVMLILLSGLALGYLSVMIYVFLGSQPLVGTLYSTIVFYMLNSVLNHELERTLKPSLIVEYILVSLICFLIVLLLP